MKEIVAIIIILVINLYIIKSYQDSDPENPQILLSPEDLAQT